MRLLEVLLFTLGGLWQGIRQDYNLLEIALIAGLALAWRKGWRPRKMPMPRIPRPAVTALLLAVGFVALRLALLPVMPAPVPVVTDEFSHLLLADTLLHGRVANPVHPFWPHFESIHILMRPHYVSPYFPGHALWLAAGRLVTGSAWAGVLVQCGIFLAVLYWMLRGWMPARWALFGVLLAGLRFAVGSYWINNLHGGFLPAIGGALVAGAFARVRRKTSGLTAPGGRGSVTLWNRDLRERSADGFVLGLGMAILMSTRPVEGTFYSIPFVAILAWDFRRNVGALAVASAPVLLCAGALGVYFSHITGSPFVTAYQIHQKTYGWPMTLAFLKPPVVAHTNVEFKRYYEYELTEHERVDGPIHFIQYLAFRIQEYWRFFLGPALTVPLLMIRQVWRGRRILLIGASGGLFAILLEGGASPHYLAPATAVLIAIVVECCRHLRASRVYIVKLLPVTMALVLTLRIGAQAAGLPYTQKLNFQTWCCRAPGNSNKSRIAAELASIPGNHLVFVRAKTDEYNLLQWIYNDADIDGSRIVWARDLGPEKNAELVRYFSGRQAWMVDPNVEPATCVRIPRPDGTGL
jgi:hypothetical protein